MSVRACVWMCMCACLCACALGIWQQVPAWVCVCVWFYTISSHVSTPITTTMQIQNSPVPKKTPARSTWLHSVYPCTHDWATDLIWSVYSKPKRTTPLPSSMHGHLAGHPPCSEVPTRTSSPAVGMEDSEGNPGMENLVLSVRRTKGDGDCRLPSGADSGLLWPQSGPQRPYTLPALLPNMLLPDPPTCPSSDTGPLEGWLGDAFQGQHSGTGDYEGHPVTQPHGGL